MSRVIVIGAGLGGLSAALIAHQAGHSVKVISKGIGGMGLSAGTLDIYGRDADGKCVEDPFKAIDGLKESDHPYAKIGAPAVRAGVDWLIEAVPELGYQHSERNQLIATAVGSVRPTWALPTSMADGALHDGDRVRVIGLSDFKDFPAQLIADNLSRSQLVDVQAEHSLLELTAREPEDDSTATTFARALDDSREGKNMVFNKLSSQLRAVVQEGEKVLLPAMAGLEPSTFGKLRESISTELAEVPVPPPSVPGRRLNDALVELCRQARIDIQYNATVIGFNSASGKITEVLTQRAGRVTADKADYFIYAGGGFESGTLTRDSYGEIHERIFDLPVWTAFEANPDENPRDEELLRSGIRVDEQMRPLGVNDQPVLSNLHCVGGLLGGALAWHEHSGEGITLGSAWAAVQALNERTGE